MGGVVATTRTPASSAAATQTSGLIRLGAGGGLVAADDGGDTGPWPG